MSLLGLFTVRSSSLRPMIFAADAALDGDNSVLLRVRHRALTGLVAGSPAKRLQIRSPIAFAADLALDGEYSLLLGLQGTTLAGLFTTGSVKTQRPGVSNPQLLLKARR